ncbi:GNAT family N-acetyltransferase [Actinomadura parmotrematis]|uniref:GNAT family N-acetyltransferase n=1 Tax=Actinomadura parmotrematis TaxID=2864039 RepID=A0ABS7FQG1_9ACTN|nr:GNAT family protein [Actinomadura parmotrematis]MBW8481797.1 GNAT family N-acetyltransferase [Actinomadura parmotrematis]
MTLVLVPVAVPVVEALAAGDLEAARTLSGLPLTDYFVTGEARALWERRLVQIAADPGTLDWIARPAVVDGAVVGHAGFHLPPDGDGRVSISYAVDPAHRRRGHARAMLAALLERARTEPAVRIVRAEISPGNAASLATIAGAGFVRVGEQWDEEDGLEILFETAA